MTQEQLVDAMCGFLLEKVAPQIKLKKANDEDALSEPEWEHPSVNAVYLPFRSANDLTEDGFSTAPSLVVMPGPGAEGAGGAVTQTLRIVIHIWDPGADVLLEADRAKAWRSMATLSELIRTEALAQRYIGGAVAATPIRFGTYNDDDAVQKMWPYVVGWVDIPMQYQVSRRLPVAVGKHIM